MAKKQKATRLEKGVERRKSHYRFRHRAQWTEEGQKKQSVHVKTFEFLPNEQCQAGALPPNHELWEHNARADANAYSQKYHHDLERQVVRARIDPVVGGTLKEWLERYRDEGLKGHALGQPNTPAPFPLEHRAQAGRDHDIGQINTLLRMGDFEVQGDDAVLASPRSRANALKNRPMVFKDIRAALLTEVNELTKAQFKTILAHWSHGKAVAATKRRLRTTLRMCFQFHTEHYDMDASMDWMTVQILGDGAEKKARALTRDEWEKIDRAMSATKLHPSVEGSLRFIRWTGCRRGEAFALRWENITWPKPGLRNVQPAVAFKRTKATRGHYRGRTIAIPQEAVEALRLAAGIGAKSNDWPTKGWVFPQPYPREGRLAGEDPVPPQTVYQAFNRLFVKDGDTKVKDPNTVAMGVKRASPHMLRHTRATELSVVMPERQLMQYFGWSDPNTPGIYIHMAEEMGLVVRDADNNLRSVAQLESEQEVIDYAATLSLKKQEELIGKMAADLAARKTVSKKASKRA